MTEVFQYGACEQSVKTCCRLETYETQKELKIQYPEEARISRELLLITRKLRMHIPVEQVLEEFAERVPSEDVKSFVTVFVTAKKSGGDMIFLRDYS